MVRDTLIYKVEGDTIRIERIKWRDRWFIDTLRINDTVKITSKRIDVKEKKVIDWWGCLAFCGLITFFVWGLIRRFKV